MQEIGVIQKDMPNFFVELLTVADGRVYSEVKEIVVPPEKRVLNVEVQPSSDSYRPGQKAQVKLKLTDFHGAPYVGSTVVAIYDKSVEYISGGSNVPEIRGILWKWRRHHHPQTETSLDRSSGNLVPKGAKGMNDLGVFGATAADESRAMEGRPGRGGRMMGGMMGGMGGGMMPGTRRMSAAKGMANGMAMDAAAPMEAAAMSVPASVGPMRGRPERSGRQRAAISAAERAPLGAAHDSQAVRRHGLVGRLADDRQGRHGRSLAEHAREPYQLANQGLGHGPRDQRGRRADRRGHPQGPDYSHGNPALLRPEG